MGLLLRPWLPISSDDAAPSPSLNSGRSGITNHPFERTMGSKCPALGRVTAPPARRHFSVGTHDRRVDSNSLPMVPDLEVFPEPVRYLILILLGVGVLSLAGLVLVGLTSSPTVVLEATIVDAPPSDGEVYVLSAFSEGSPVRAAVEEALRTGSASVETSAKRVRSEEVPIDAFYVEHDERVVSVDVNS